MITSTRQPFSRHNEIKSNASNKNLVQDLFFLKPMLLLGKLIEFIKKTFYYGSNDTFYDLI